MKILIIEDEQPAVQKLMRLLRSLDTKIEITGCLSSVVEATNWLLENQHPDLIIMDIQLEDGICFEIFENVALKTPVIFTTAYDTFAIRAFKVNSVDYLLKPVEMEELSKAIQKFQQVHQKEDFPGMEELIRRFQPTVKERFLIKIGEHFRPVQTTDIMCFFIKERCNFIRISTGKEYPLDLSLDKVEKMIDPKLFFRVNREYIIHFNTIKDIVAYSTGRLKIKLTGGHEADEILVSRERVAGFKLWMDR